jgi:hypothetical protein
MDKLLREAYTTLRSTKSNPKDREEARMFVRRFWDQPGAKEVITKVLKELDDEEAEINEILFSQ